MFTALSEKLAENGAPSVPIGGPLMTGPRVPFTVYCTDCAKRPPARHTNNPPIHFAAGGAIRRMIHYVPRQAAEQYQAVPGIVKICKGLSVYHSTRVTLYGPIITGFAEDSSTSWRLFWSVAVFWAVGSALET